MDIKHLIPENGIPQALLLEDLYLEYDSRHELVSLAIDVGNHMFLERNCISVYQINDLITLLQEAKKVWSNSS